jgi:hypothetical protein
MPTYKCQHTNANIQMPTYKCQHTNANIQMPTYKCQHTNANIQVLDTSVCARNCISIFRQSDVVVKNLRPPLMVVPGGNEKYWTDRRIWDGEVNWANNQLLNWCRYLCVDRPNLISIRPNVEAHQPAVLTPAPGTGTVQASPQDLGMTVERTSLYFVSQ